ncbi:MAG: nitroreductase family protein [Bacillota bacterium]
MEKLDFIYKRSSVRKFSDKEVKEDDLKEILKAGMNAPSAKNMQNWKFVVVRNKEKINDIKNLVEKKHKKIIEKIDDNEKTQRFEKMINYYTFFKKAPILILFFASEYNSSTANLLKEACDEKEYNLFKNADPGIQSIGAAIENVLLASATLGYGTCWMTGPNFAINEIHDYLDLDFNGYNLVAMSPLGVPKNNNVSSPKRKDFSEVVKFID